MKKKTKLDNYYVEQFLKFGTCNTQKLLIALDFDGTLSEHIYPEPGVGKEIYLDLTDYIFHNLENFYNLEFEKYTNKLSTIEIAKHWKSCGHKLILWTCREDYLFNDTPSLTDAIGWCADRGLFFDYVNENHENAHNARKILADRYIDDKGCDIYNLKTWNMFYWSSLTNPSYYEILSKIKK